MPKFILTYRGGHDAPVNEEENAKWFSWMKGCGGALAEFGAPAGQSKTLSAAGVKDGSGAQPLTGYTIMQADNIDAIIELAKPCPLFESAGAIFLAAAQQRRNCTKAILPLGAGPAKPSRTFPRSAYPSPPHLPFPENAASGPRLAAYGLAG